MKILLTPFLLLILTACHSNKKGKIEYETVEKNFIINHGDKYNAKFVFKNTGEADLNIKSVDASCLCTNVKYNKSVIAPGKTDSILVTFTSDPQQRGEVVQKIIVETNTKPILSTLTIRGVIK